MKNLLLLVPVLFIGTAFGADDAPSSNCVQILQPAVSPDGVCEVFSTPCDVPDGWKSLPSCDYVAPSDFGSDIRAVEKRRSEARANWTKKKLEEKAKEEDSKSRRVVGAPRVGRATFTKRVGKENTRLSEKSAISNFDSKRSTTPRFSKATAYDRYKNLNQKGGYKNKPTRLEKYQKKLETTGRRPAWETSTLMNREGYLSTKGWFDTVDKNMKSNPSDEGRYWKELHPNKVIKKTPVKLSNRKGWKGERLEGNMYKQFENK